MAAAGLGGVLRWPLRLYLAVAALWVGGAFAISATAVAGHHIRINAGGDLAIIDHPTGAAVLWGAVQDLFFALLTVLLVACVIQQAVSYRRAASTLAAVALFSPLRRRVQQVVDRRFNRARYDADQTVAAFAARLKDAVDLDSVRGELAWVVHQALEPAHISIWISQHD